jgi:branched-chain amino acid transport system ATP-binding protein
MLELADISVRYGRIQALRGLSLSVGRNQIVAVLGANGAGKTTLLRSIMGLEPCEGDLSLEGRSLAGLRTFQRAREGIALVPEGRRLFANFSVGENLRIGAIGNVPRDELEARIDQACETFPVLKARYRQRAGTLSGGEAQMLTIARALMARPRVLLLDEPSVGLMPKIVTEIFELVRTIARRGLSVLIVEQNAHKALQIASFAAVLEVGRVVLAGPAEEIRQDPRIRNAYLGGH